MEPSNGDTTGSIGSAISSESNGKAPFIFDQYPDIYALCKELIAATTEKYWSRRQLNKNAFEQELQLMQRLIKNIRASQSAAYKEINQAASAARSAADRESFSVWMATTSRLQAERDAVEPATDNARAFASGELRAKQAEYEMQANLGLFNKTEWLAENSRQAAEAKTLHDRNLAESQRLFQETLALHTDQVETLSKFERLWFASHSRREIAAHDDLEAWVEDVKNERVKLLQKFLHGNCPDTFRRDLTRSIARVQMY